MAPEMTDQDHQNEELTSRKIRAAFDSISCKEDLKERTRSYVAGETSRRQKSLPQKMKWGVSLACLVLFLGSGFGGYQLYYTEAATISIDVNPSIELELNRWGKVVGEKTYGKDSEEVLSSVSLKHLEYEAALERLLGSEAMKKYLNADSVVTITVENRTNNEQLMTNLQSCVDSTLVQHHNGVTAEYASVDEHMCQEAHSHGMSVGKYNAIQELIEEDPEATVDEFKNQSMKEIKTHMEHCMHDGESNQETSGGNCARGGQEQSDENDSQAEEGGCGRHNNCSDGHHSERPDTEHDKFRIQIGNGEGELFVSMEASPFLNAEDPLEKRDLTITFYQDDKGTQPVQQIKTTATEAYFQDIKIEDVNFDGYMDFYWPSMKGASNWLYTYWIWDEKTHGFIEDPYGLSSLSNPVFDGDGKTIQSQYTINWQAGSIEFWKYEDEKLLLIRNITFELPDDQKGVQTLSVDTRIENQMVEVYHAEVPVDMEAAEYEKECEKILQWNDLTYYGDAY